MSRDLDTALAAEVDKPVLRPFIAISIDLPDPVHVFTGRGLLTFADSDGVSRDWIGAGEVGAIDSLGESTDGSASGFRALLYKIPAEFREDIEQQAVRGAKIEVIVSALTEDYAEVVGLHTLNKYRLDRYNITDGGDTLSVEVTGESRGIDQRRPPIKRFTHEYQQRLHPGDLFFAAVHLMTEVSILWAQSESKTPSVGGGLPSATGGGFLTRNIRSV